MDQVHATTQVYNNNSKNKTKPFGVHNKNRMHNNKNSIVEDLMKALSPRSVQLKLQFY